MNTFLPLYVHHLNRARRLMRARQYAAALQPLRRLETLQLSPRQAAAVRHLLGVCWLRLRKPRRAERYLRAAARLNPSRANTHALLGRVAGAPEEAMACQMRALALSPRNASLRSRAGLACLRAGDHEAGLELLREAAEEAPAKFAVLRRLVLGLMEAGLPDEAEQVLRQARFAFPDCGGALALLGRLRCAELCADERPDAEQAGPTILPFLRVAGLPSRRDPVAAAVAGPHLVRLRRRSALGRPG